MKPKASFREGEERGDTYFQPKGIKANVAKIYLLSTIREEGKQEKKKLSKAE